MANNTRRQFLFKGAVYAGSATAFGAITGLWEPPAACAARLRKQWKGRLIAVENKKAINSRFKENAALVTAMTNRAMLELTGKRTIAQAWRTIVGPGDTVGIKLNCLASPSLSTSPAMVNAIVRGLYSVGIPNERIILYEQYKGQLIRRGSGFQLNENPAKGPLVRHLGPKSNLTNAGWAGYEKTASRHGSGPSNYSNMSKICTALINVPVFKDHNLSGMTGAMKNLTHGNINNPHHYHKHDCNPQIADIYNHPRLKDKVRLTICDGLKIQYEGGPQASIRHRVAHHRIYVGTDAVAMDAWGLKEIEKLRKQAGKIPISKRHKQNYLVRAQELGLGIADPRKIDFRLTRLG